MWHRFLHYKIPPQSYTFQWYKKRKPQLALSVTGIGRTSDFGRGKPEEELMGEGLRTLMLFYEASLVLKLHEYYQLFVC
jgi:hypothetical protein